MVDAQFPSQSSTHLQLSVTDSRRARRGLWSAKKVELPGDFKKRAREGDDGPAKQVDMGKKTGWWERLGMWLGGKT